MGSKVQNVVLAVMFMSLIGLTIVYANLTQNLKIETVATYKSEKWDIHFENLKSSITGKATLAETNQLSILSNSTTISGSAGNLSLPGDSIVYTFNIVNKGTIPAVLGADLIKSTPTCSSTNTEGATLVCNNLIYTITYLDGTQIKKGDTLNEGETKEAKLTLSLSDSMTSLANADVEIKNIMATLNYIQN